MQKLAPSDGKSQPAPTPRSSDRVLEVLKAVAASPGLNLTGVAGAVDLAPSTALRQLRSLEAAGMVERGDDQAYRPGIGLIRLAHQVISGSSLAERAAPLLARVAAESGESAYLAIADIPGSCVYIATAPGPQQLRHAGWLGRRIPMESTAVGAALRGEIDEDGAVYRADGHEVGVAAASAPVYDVSGSVVAAISAVGPTFRLVGAELAAARRAVADASGELTRLLGG